MTRIVNAFSRVSPRPLRNTFSTALRSVSELEVIAYCIETDDGIQAWGESVETPAITGDTNVAIQNALAKEIPMALIGTEFHSARATWNSAISPLDVVASAKAAVDLALYDLEAQLAEVSMNTLLGCKVESVATDVAVPIASLSEIESLVSIRLAEGFSSYKVKLGMEDLTLSLEKLLLIRSLIGNDSGLRVDANQAWSVEHSIEFLQSSSDLNIEYLEQPIISANKRGLAIISKASDTKIMADESCFTMGDMNELIDLGSADLVNLKVLKSGGITPLLEIAQRAEQAGMGISIGSMMEGDRGVTVASILAGALAPTLVHDLDAAWWAKESTIKYSDGRVWLL